MDCYHIILMNVALGNPKLRKGYTHGVSEYYIKTDVSFGKILE